MRRSGDGHLLNWRQTSTITQRQITTDSRRMMERTLIDADGSYCFYGKVLHQRGRDTHPDFSLASCIISSSLSFTLSPSLSFSLCLSENPSPIVLDLFYVDFVAKLLLSSSFVTPLSRNLDARRIQVLVRFVARSFLRLGFPDCSNLVSIRLTWFVEAWLIYLGRL